jgi:hypothetical protein
MRGHAGSPTKVGGMLVAATVCPHPPLLVPEVSVTAPRWLDDLRAEAFASVRRLVSSDVDTIVAVGAGAATETVSASAGGSLRAYGVDVSAGGEPRSLPLALTIAAWLLDQAEWAGARTYAVLADTEPAADCARIGSELSTADDRVGLLVMGDGSAKRSTEAPGYYDPRSTAFDAGVVTALATADVDYLVGLDPALAAELWVAGRPAWQCLAGALASTDADVNPKVRYDDAPRGVGYFVVDW